MAAPKPHHRWRENIEALVMAIVVALLFKYFVLEISKIPSGSMQPTLMGNAETGVFDRTVVDKLSYQYRDPERWEIVVFKHPLERSRIMVKRLVGMPDEELKIEHGDLWTRPTGGSDWRILRRPPAVQREMWRSLDVRGEKRTSWSVVNKGQDWRVHGKDVAARGDGAARFQAGEGPITDEYLDGYPPSLVAGVLVRDPSWGRNPVGDVRVEGTLTSLAGTQSIGVELTEGLRVYQFRLPGPAASADEAVEVRIRDSAASTERVEHGSTYRLPAGRALDFAVENLDDRLALEVDGETLLAVEIEPSARQEASLTVSVTGEGADFAGLHVLRDLYYLTPEGRSAWSVVIPRGNYVMLGDNTQDSADGRLWKAMTYRYRESPGSEVQEARGNHREGGENPSYGKLADGAPAIRFKDVWGENHWFARSAVVEPSTFPGNEPLVPRELVLGRALAVFWPIKPLEGLWRLAWLR